MKTIRQIADEIGVSKQAVQQKLKKEPLATACRQATTRNGNTIYIDNQGVELIKAVFSTSEKTSLSATNDKQLVDFFKAQLEEKDRQIAEKDKQIADITVALVAAQQTAAAAQALHAGTMKQIGSTGGEAPADDIEAENSEPAKPLAEPNEKIAKSWFLGNIFKKNKK